jgi:drug/metabolite transporter (DMT)-like permease
MSRGDLTRLVLVMFLWALCFPLIATGLSAAPPLTFAALRAFIAGIGLLLPAFVLRRPLPQGGRVWLALLGVGLSATGLGFGGMFLAGGTISPGVATVVANTQPLIAAVLAYWVLRERLGARRQVSLFVGFIGIVLLTWSGFDGVNITHLQTDANYASVTGIGYILFGALGVAVGNILLKYLAHQVDLLMATGWQFMLGGVSLWLAALAFEAPAQVVWDLPFVVVLLTLGLPGTALAFGLWFSLLHRGELTRLNTFTFLTPVFALIMGVIYFSERLSLTEIAGIVLTLAGVWWVSGSRATGPSPQ